VFSYEDSKDKESADLDAQFYRIGFKQMDSLKKNKTNEFDFDAEDLTKEENELQKKFYNVMAMDRFA